MLVRNPVSALVGLMLAALVASGGCTAGTPTVVDDMLPPSDSEATATAPASLSALTVGLEPVADGFNQPLFATGARDDSGRLFVLEKTGRIWILRDGARSKSPWLDITRLVSTDSERGLLGIAFTPDFAETGAFYINYTDAGGTTQVARLTTAPTVDRSVNTSLLEPVLSIAQPYANHNGGMIAFGPDGFLYVGTGDGGSGGDPHGNGQRTDTLLGKLLRIDPESAARDDKDHDGVRYAIPEDNPFAEGTGGLPEIWATGLRNPWRFSFDRTTGDLWIGDVGQNAWEEIDHVRYESGLEPGLNFGWATLEGTHPYPEGAEPDNTGALTAPVIEYDHSAGNSVTGGYVYRGSAYPALAGVYIYGDFGSGRIWGAEFEGGSLRTRELLDSGLQIASFGEDDGGELYVVDFGGGVYRLTAQ